MTLGISLLFVSLLSLGEATLTYTVTDSPGTAGEAGFWEIKLQATGIDPSAGAIEFHPQWGWPDDDAYLTIIDSTPAVREGPADGSASVLDLPQDWTGDLAVTYRVRLATRGGEAQVPYGLRPSRGDGYAFGYSNNTILRPIQDGQSVEGSVTIELVAGSDEGEIVTGWGGRASGRQRVQPDTPWGNSPIAFGTPLTSARSTETTSRFPIECYQFGRGLDVTQRVLDLLTALAPAAAHLTGEAPRLPSRAFLTDAMGGGMGSDYGLHVGVLEETPPESVARPEFSTIVAHEMFHEWLGLRLQPVDNSMVWFHEGFTEYFAQWLAASTGVVPHSYFAETLTQYDRFARTNTSFGVRTFTDPTLEWRDGDGPNELMAYRGAPVLALALDVELRTNGFPGLPQLIRDLLKKESDGYSLANLREWFSKHGLSDLWQRSVAGLEVAPAVESLTRLGFEREEAPLDVAYLGLRTAEVGAAWRVEAIDPSGPTVEVDIQTGDLITGYFPDNGTPTPLIEIDSPYTFGLARFTPHMVGAFLEIRRGENELKVFVEPATRPWGLRSVWRAGDEVKNFFSFDPLQEAPQNK